MYEEKKLDLRLRAAEAQIQAQERLLTLLAARLIAESSDATALLAELRTAASYDGPSGTQKAFAQLASNVIPGS
ncbi:hypothetical protein ABE488_00840 [Luteimonas sp. TWI662]|uniref:hypothetical protein n=1 Tax=Luteimonas sp. TWI662 TaxID=3136789 RepID=UPI00320AFA37